jgi:hypothetical protein
MLEEIGKDFKPLVKRQPKDIIRVLSRTYVNPIRNDLTASGYKEVAESIDAVVKLSELLAKPENHLQVKSRQRGQKPVQTRTIADMVNEMEGELTELPKYTAYAKVLQGNTVWKGKIVTMALPKIPYGCRFNEITQEVVKFKTGTLLNSIYIRSTQTFYCNNRSKIEEEIRDRQESWRPKEEESTTPKPAKPKKPNEPKKRADEPPPSRY